MKPQNVELESEPRTVAPAYNVKELRVYIWGLCIFGIVAMESDACHVCLGIAVEVKSCFWIWQPDHVTSCFVDLCRAESAEVAWFWESFIRCI